jgi:hypothetical protein
VTDLGGEAAAALVQLAADDEARAHARAHGAEDRGVGALASSMRFIGRRRICLTVPL